MLQVSVGTLYFVDANRKEDVKVASDAGPFLGTPALYSQVDNNVCMASMSLTAEIDTGKRFTRNKHY